MSTVWFVLPEAIPGSKWRRLGSGSEIEMKSEACAPLHEDDDSGQRRAIGPWSVLGRRHGAAASSS